MDRRTCERRIHVSEDICWVKTNRQAKLDAKGAVKCSAVICRGMLASFWGFVSGHTDFWGWATWPWSRRHNKKES